MSEVAWSDRVKKAETNEKRHANDAVYYRNASSILMAALRKGVGDDRLHKILDEMHATDLINTVS